MAGDKHDSSEPRKNRRRFLKALGVVGITGLAGCGGDGDGATDTPTDTDGDMGTPTDTMGDTATPTDTETETATETATATEEAPSLPGDPAPLVSFNGVSDGTLNISPNATTISGVITNPYLFDIANGEVTLTPPSDAWEISSATGNTFDTLESQSSQDVEWEVSIPAVAGEEFDLTASVSYETSGGEDSTDLETTQPVFVDPYIGTDFQELAIAPEYYDDLTADQEAPGELPGEEVEVELDLSDWADAVDFQLQFSDYWTSDAGARFSNGRSSRPTARSPTTSRPTRRTNSSTSSRTTAHSAGPSRSTPRRTTSGGSRTLTPPGRTSSTSPRTPAN
jgi:hypothetical protein